jgi:NAD(P)-dependent dehydrogenase (short-subunit alcohol dehydrogenase family)
MRAGTALVTGAAQRIGRAIARDLAAHGWAVAVHYNSSAAEADSLVAEIAGAGGRAVALQADLAQEHAVCELVPRAVAALGPLDCLINNASTFQRDDWDSVSRASWDAHMEANLRAPFVLTQAFATQLPEDRDGCVINMLDQRVWTPTPYFTSYTISKIGLWALTRTLALALAPRVRVNGIGPGPTLPSARQDDAQFNAQWASLPLRRRTTPEDICSAVRFILASPSLTGQMLALDAGQHLGWSQEARGVAVDD